MANDRYEEVAERIEHALPPNDMLAEDLTSYQKAIVQILREEFSFDVELKGGLADVQRGEMALHILNGYLSHGLSAKAEVLARQAVKQADALLAVLRG